MSKRKTISTRWSDWTRTSPLDKILARTSLVLLALSLNGLWMHLWILSGFWRTFGLVAMIVFVVLAEGIMIWRKQWWWVAFWGTIIALVGAFEIGSYFFGS
jgi:hypothetical protein